VISPTLFAMMVLMALATTVMTSPLLGVLYRPGADDLAASGHAVEARRMAGSRTDPITGSGGD